MTIREEVREHERPYTIISISYISGDASNATHLCAKQTNAYRERKMLVDQL
jgi:hypothetical protein